MLNWSYIESDTSKSLFIIDEEGKTTTISDAHPNFLTLKSLLEKHDRNEGMIIQLLDPAARLFGDGYTHKNGIYYIGGSPVPMEVLDTLLELREIFVED